MGSDRLPDGWRCYPLGDPRVCVLNPPKREVRDRPDSTKVTFVPMSAVDDESGSIVAAETREIGQVRKGYTYFAENDVVFAKITPCMENGKAAIARGLVNGIGFGTTEFHVLRAGPQVIPEWLHAFVRRADTRAAAKKNMHGAAGQQRVPVEFLEQLKMPVPPTQDEQRRIVARIEELTARLDEARRLHRAASNSLSTLMAATVSGFFAKGEDEGWSVATVKELCGDPQYGYTASAEHAAVGPKFLRITDIQAGRVDWSAVPHCRCDCVGKYRVAAGDIFFARTGATTGKTFLVNEAPEAVFASYLIRIRPGLAILPAFLYWFFQSSQYWEAVEMKTEDGNRPNMNGTKLAGLRIPFPKDKTEQRRIVSQLDTLRRHADQLARAQADIDAELVTLTPALLAKAFCGEL